MALCRTRLVICFLSNRSEEMEASIMVDVLRRAGVEVVVASVEDTLQVHGTILWKCDYRHSFPWCIIPVEFHVG